MCQEPYEEQPKVPPHKAYVLRERPAVNPYVSGGGMCAEVCRSGLPWLGCLLSFVRGAERPGKSHLSRDLGEVRS